MQVNIKTGSGNWHASWCRLLAIGIALPAALLLAWVLGQQQGCAGTALTMRRPASSAAGASLWSFLPAYSRQQQPQEPAAYVPSTWEQEWMAAASKEMVERPGAVCEWMAARGKQVQGWLAGVAAWQGGASARSNQSSVPGPQGLPADIFSRFEFPGSGITTPIEPLVGHLRDPLAPQCNASSKVHIESRDHILLLGLSPQQFRQLYPGRALLMDFGSSDFKTSVHWLMQRYAALGVEFDEAWGYELRKMDLNEYWRWVPADAKLRLHFLNEGIPADPAKPEHPIHLIKQRVRRGDFLVIKLDVDAPDVELPFMRAIAADADLRGLIGELHFEMHYTHKDMPWFGTSGGNVTLNDVLTLFGDLRRKGLRLHYWP